MAQPLAPPLGIKPRTYWVEERIDAIREAIVRYAVAGRMVPDEWVIELSEHIMWLNEN